MQGGWQPPPRDSRYGAPPGGTSYARPSAHGAPLPPGTVTPEYGAYEFNPYENSIIDRTARRAKLWGVISTIIGVLQIFGSCGMWASPTLATFLPAGIVAMVVGLTFIGTGNSLKAVVTTHGNDLMHLMQAMEKTSTAFLIQIVCSIIAFVLAVIGTILLLFVFVAVAATR